MFVSLDRKCVCLVGEGRLYYVVVHLIVRPCCVPGSGRAAFWIGGVQASSLRDQYTNMLCAW